jgi:putative flippase GtrA
MQGFALFPAKIAVETALFPLNFLLQRDWVFTARRRPGQ